MKSIDCWLSLTAWMFCRCRNGEQGHHDPQCGPASFRYLNHGTGRWQQWQGRRNQGPPDAIRRWVIGSLHNYDGGCSDHHGTGTFHHYPVDGDNAGSYDHDDNECPYNGSSTGQLDFPVVELPSFTIIFLDMIFRTTIDYQKITSHCIMICICTHILKTEPIAERLSSKFRQSSKPTA